MPVLSNVLAISYIWLLNTWNVSSATEGLNFCFYFILIELNLIVSTFIEV